MGGPQTGPPPWPSQTEGLGQRAAALGFDARGAHASLHTHTPDGVIHMEADDPYPYQVDHVQVCGVPLGSDRLGSEVDQGDKKVHVYVNGEPGEPESG